ncbi:MAG: PBECR4 domain-containing protein [Bacillota bacterium]|nr:PBECR4 domain-containing protein [Bacillota bacterium]
MKKQQDRIKLVKEISKAANLYRTNLVGKQFMYVFDNRYIEVLYKASSFRHLTGVDTYLSAKQYYRYAAKNVLSASQIYFNKNHPYDLAVRKVKHLSNLATMASSENFMLEEITTDTKQYKFGTTDLKFTLCMNKELDDFGNEKGDCYIVESLRDEDCFSRSKDAYVVTHIFSKPNDVKQYTDLLFMDSSASMTDLSENIKCLLVPELLKNN